MKRRNEFGLLAYMNDCVLTYKDCLCESVLYPSRNTLYSFISCRSINCLFVYSFIHLTTNNQQFPKDRFTNIRMNAQQANSVEASIHFDKQCSQLSTTIPNTFLTNELSLLRVLFYDREQLRMSYEST